MFALLIVLLLFSSVYACKNSNQTVGDLLDQFNKDWEAKNLDAVAKMYDEDVVFINTLAKPQVFYGRKALTPVLKGFMDKFPALREHYYTTESTEDCELLVKVGYFTVDKAQTGTHYPCVMIFRRNDDGTYSIIRDDMRYP